MKLYILDNGTIHGNWNIFYSDRKDAPEERIEFPCSMFLIDTPQGKILFDAGVYPGGIRAKSLSYRYQERRQTLEEQLALCSTELEEIKIVILSHLHYDHAGNLFLFPQTEVICSRTEYEHAWNEVRKGDAADDRAYFRGDFDVPVGKWTLLDREAEIVPGVEVIFLPGHTPGLIGLVVHLEGGTFILPQDCLYTERNFGPPAARSGLVYSDELFYASVEKVRALQTKYDAKIIYGHDGAQRKTLRIAPDYYS